MLVVYIPATIITAVMVLMLIVGMVVRLLGFAVTATATLAVIFGLCTRTRDELLDYRPGLAGQLELSVATVVTRTRPCERIFA